MALRTPLLACALLLAGCGGGGGGSSTSTTIQHVDPNDTVSVSPSSISVSTTTTLTAPTAGFQVNISGLDPGQLVYLSLSYSHNGILKITPIPTHFLPAPLSIQFNAPTAIALGVHHDTVQVGFCMDQACTQPMGNTPQTINVTYTVIQSTFTLTGFSPSQAMAGSAGFTLTVTGTSFTSSSSVVWNGTPQQTTFVSATQLTAQIPAAEVADAGGASVGITDPFSGNTSTRSFTIQRAPLALDSLSPSNVTVGGPAYTLVVLGTGFSKSATIRWNGNDLPTTYVTDEELLAQVPTANIASIGGAAVTVNDPTSSTPSVGPQTEKITPASKDAVAYQNNAAHTGAVNFANMSLPFPSSPTWSVDVGGTPSYAIIAQGKVILKVTSSTSGPELLALNQATGAVAWGPISDSSDPAYDSGRVYVETSAGAVEAFDAGTGALDWSTPVTGQFGFSYPPTAADGIVYVSGTGSNGDLAIFALDESAGRILWTQPAGDAGDGPPAVTVDGVYTSGECAIQDFRPATGEKLWSFQGPCSGGETATPVVANQVAYSADGTLESTFSGFIGNPPDTFNAETGAKLGRYTADFSPAFTSTYGYFPFNGTLTGVKLSNNAAWTFTGDGQLNGTPIAVNQYVFIGSISGNIYALDGTTGSQVWNVKLTPPFGSNSFGGFSSLAAGDGLLIVPMGTKVTAYTLSTNP